MSLLARGLSTAALLLAPLAAIPSAAVPSAAAQPHEALPAVATAPLRHSDRAVPGQYIVTLDKSLEPSALVKQLGVKPMFSYTTVLRGFAARLSTAQVDQLRRTPGVAAVEENGAVSAFGSDAAVPRTPRAAQSWGLDRIDQRRLPLDQRFAAADDGRGATAYVMDSGIDYGHGEFGGRAVPGFDAFPDGRDGQDCNGHGTHVAGTVGGTHYGVAPAARLVSVRVLDCTGSGTYAGVIAGFDWVARNAVQPAVLNASLGGPYSQAVNQAADALSDSGVLPVVAAGNSAHDACDVSPAGADRVVTVGASDQGDRETSFSNYGRCVSLFAPGQDIVSARLGGGSVAEDGTSMASPHAAGVALLYKAQHPRATSDEIATWLIAQTTKDVLTVEPNSPNRLLYTGGL